MRSKLEKVESQCKLMRYVAIVLSAIAIILLACVVAQYKAAATPCGDVAVQNLQGRVVEMSITAAMLSTSTCTPTHTQPRLSGVEHKGQDDEIRQLPITQFLCRVQLGLDKLDGALEIDDLSGQPRTPLSQSNHGIELTIMEHLGIDITADPLSALAPELHFPRWHSHLLGSRPRPGPDVDMRGETCQADSSRPTVSFCGFPTRALSPRPLNMAKRLGQEVGKWPDDNGQTLCQTTSSSLLSLATTAPRSSTNTASPRSASRRLDKHPYYDSLARAVINSPVLGVVGRRRYAKCVTLADSLDAATATHTRAQEQHSKYRQPESLDAEMKAERLIKDAADMLLKDELGVYVDYFMHALGWRRIGGWGHEGRWVRIESGWGNGRHGIEILCGSDAGGGDDDSK